MSLAALKRAWTNRPRDADSAVSTTSQGSAGEAAAEYSGSEACRSSSSISADAGPTLRSLFGANRPAMLLTYALFNVENVIRLAQPLVLGWAINDLLAGATFGLWLFVAQHLSHLGISTLRQMYDTRTFTRIYTDLATNLVVQQRGQQVEVSRVAARSVLSREYIEFFENNVPMAIRALYSVVGALLMLAWYDWGLVPMCLILLGPAVLLNRVYAEKTHALSARLHDQLEREIDVIEPGRAPDVREHYSAVAGWRIRLSDSEAMNFGAMELFVLAVIVLTLLRICSAPAVEAGDIFAVFRYLMLLLAGLDSVPRIVQQLSRLRDIRWRLRCARVA